MEVLEYVTKVALDGAYLQVVELASQGCQLDVGSMVYYVVAQAAVPVQQKYPASAESSGASAPSAGTTAAEASAVAVQDQDQLLLQSFYSFSDVVLSAFL